MINILLAELHLLARFGETREVPPIAIGRRGLANLHVFSYGGDGWLKMQSTDNRIFITCSLAVQPEGDPWTAVVEAKRFNIIKLFEGGSREMGSGAGGRLVIEGDRFHLRFRLEQLPAVFNEPREVPGAEGVAVSIRDFKRASEFLTDSAESEDTDCRKDVCELFSAGQAMGADRLLFLQTSAPTLPFDFTVRKGDLKAVVRWLRFVDKLNDGVDQVFRLALAVDANGANQMYSLSTFCGHFKLFVPKATRVFGREIIDQAHEREVAFEAVVDRQSMVSAARALGACSSKGRLICRLEADGAGDYHLRLEQCGDSESYDRLPLADTNLLEAFNRAPFEVGAKSLVSALTRITAKQVRLRFRPQGSWLSVLSVAGDREVLTRTSPHVAE